MNNESNNFLDDLFSDSYNFSAGGGGGGESTRDIEEEIRQLEEFQSGFDMGGGEESSSNHAPISALTSSTLAAALSRRSSRSSASGSISGPTTSADQLLVTIVEKSLLTLDDANAENNSEETTAAAVSEVASPEGSSGTTIRSLISEMVNSVEDSSNTSKLAQNLADSECEQGLLGGLLDSQFKESGVGSSPSGVVGKFGTVTPAHPLMASQMAPPPAIVPAKPREQLPKVRPEKPSKITLKYLLETIDGDTDDDMADISPSKVLTASSALFSAANIRPSTTSNITSSSSITNSTTNAIIPVEKDEVVILPTPPLPPPFQPVLTTTIEPSFDDHPSSLLIQPSQLFDNAIQQYDNVEPAAATTDAEQQQTGSFSDGSESSSSFLQPISMPIMSALNALETLDNHHHQLQFQSCSPLAPPSSSSDAAVVDYLTDLQPEPSVHQQQMLLLSENSASLAPEIIDLETSESISVDLKVAPPTDDDSLEKEKSTTTDSSDDKDRPPSPEQVCVELLNDIVEMASDKVSDDRREKEGDDHQQPPQTETITDVGLDKTADEDVEVSKLFATTSNLVAEAAAAKRRRSLELFVSLTTNNHSTKSPSPLISSTRTGRSSSSLEAVDELMTILGSASTSPSKDGKALTESRSTPESRSASPNILMDANNSTSTSSERRRSPTPIISTTEGTGSSSAFELHSPSLPHFEEEDNDQSMDHQFGSQLSPRSSPSRPLLPPMSFRARSRSLVIDVRSHSSGSELSLKTTTTTTTTTTAEFSSRLYNINNNNKRVKRGQTVADKPSKKARIPELIDSKNTENSRGDKDDDDDSEITESSSSSITTGTRKEPSVQHPDISSSVDDRPNLSVLSSRSSAGSCSFKVAAQHRQCCCGRSETMLFEEEEEEEKRENAEEKDEEEMEGFLRGKGSSSSSRHHPRRSCCHRVGVNSSASLTMPTETSSSSSSSSSSVMTASMTSSSRSHHHHGHGKLLPPPVTIHHHSSAGHIPTVSINFNAENSTTIIHINPNSKSTANETESSNSTTSAAASKEALPSESDSEGDQNSPQHDHSTSSTSSAAAALDDL